MVSQINRQGYLKAKKNNGMYDMTALKEANEIETCASVILGIYSDTTLITSNQVKIGILKNRDGSRVGDAYQVPANYPYQLIGSVGSSAKNITSNATAGTFSDLFGSFDDEEDSFQPLGINFVEPEIENSDFEVSDSDTYMG